MPMLDGETGVLAAIQWIQVVVKWLYLGATRMVNTGYPPFGEDTPTPGGFESCGGTEGTGSPPRR